MGVNRQILVGATPNENKEVGGWLPFVVAWNPVYGRMWSHGPTWANSRRGAFNRRNPAVVWARGIAKEHHANMDDEIVETPGCHRCWDDDDPRHLLRDDQGDVVCGHCKRSLTQRRK